MAELEEECIFVVKTKDIDFNTGANGDRIIMLVHSLSKKQTATLAWLFNHPADTTLKFDVKLNG